MCLILTDRREGLITAGERLCGMVRASRPSRYGEAIPVSFSVGATMGRPGDDLDSLLKRADGLLYEAKKAGKNCVESDAD